MILGRNAVRLFLGILFCVATIRGSEEMLRNAHSPIVDLRSVFTAIANIENEDAFQRAALGLLSISRPVTGSVEDAPPAYQERVVASISADSDPCTCPTCRYKREREYIDSLYPAVQTQPAPVAPARDTQSIVSGGELKGCCTIL